jgi:hypothetical protein
MPGKGLNPAYLCNSLLRAESEKEVIKILKDAGYWNDVTVWHYFGDMENNFSIIGNQQADPAAALTEKLVNSVDAVLMRECYLEGKNPESPDAPRSIPEALERYFKIKAGNLANISASQRSDLAKNIGLVATGEKGNPNYLVFDRGEGQTPSKLPDTLLSLSKSNKLRIPFVQGKFNMGGTGTFQFCGKHNFQLIISRRCPDCADKSDPSWRYWGFTIVRREEPSQGRRNSVYTYLALEEDTILTFDSSALQIPEIGRGTQQFPVLEWGTIIKMYEYEMPGLKTNIKLDLFNKISLLLPRSGLPIRFYERRSYPGHTQEATMAGLHVRLEEDKHDNLEDNFPADLEFKVRGESIRARIYAFRKGKSSKYRKHEGILFTINGQTHASFTDRFFSRSGVGLSYLADSILVVVEFVDISPRTHEDVFMNSRDRLRAGDFQRELEQKLEELLKSHPGLRELKERRRREEIEGRLAQTRPLREVLDEILRKSPSLNALFVQGTDLSNPFKLRSAAEQERFEGKPYPTYFHLKKGEERKNCHINLRFRVQFETDVVNDYFGRDNYPGHFTLRVNEKPLDDYVINIWNGIATLTVRLPSDAKVGDDLDCEAWIQDDTLIEPFYNRFTRHVLEPTEVKPGASGRRLPPAGEGEGDRQLPSGLSLPHVIEVREEEWEERNFDKYSALKVTQAESNIYDFYVNMDNIYLQTELKSYENKLDARLLEARFKYGLVLLGLALLKEDNKDHEHEECETIEERVFNVSKAVAPILLPMIESLGDLPVGEEDEELIEPIKGK